jgi:hypothetical protein
MFEAKAPSPPLLLQFPARATHELKPVLAKLRQHSGGQAPGLLLRDKAEQPANARANRYHCFIMPERIKCH